MKAVMKISVIIPVFNGEKYLHGCLYSIANQTIDDIEIIVVDNCSTDSSRQIIEDFINKWSHKRKIIFLTENRQGNSYARNTGISVATGEYIAFADQDDYVKKRFLEYMYIEAKRTDADVITSGYEAIYSNGMTKRIMRLKDREWSPYRMVSPWGKLYKKKLIDDNDIFFLSVNKGEDVYFVMNAYNNAKNVSIVSAVGYRWFSNTESFSHTEHRKINPENSIIPLFDVLEQSLYPLKGIKRDYLEYFYIKTIVHEAVFCARGKSVSVAYGYFKELEDWIDKHYPNNESNKYVSPMLPHGEEIKRRIFVSWFWKQKKKGKVKKFLDLYTRFF